MTGNTGKKLPFATTGCRNQYRRPIAYLRKLWTTARKEPRHSGHHELGQCGSPSL